MDGATAPSSTGAPIRKQTGQRGASEEPSCEVVLVKVLHADEPVLASGDEAAPVRPESHRVDRAEVPADDAKLLLIDLVEEHGLEFARLGRRRRHLRCVLAPGEHNMVKDRRDVGRVDGALGLVRLQHLERLRVEELGRLVLGGRNHVREVLADPNVADLLCVDLVLVDEFASLCVILPDVSIRRRRDDALIAVTPQAPREPDGGEPGDGEDTLVSLL
mmetsp:Transcript_11145/g.26459  ORF Transcript_11145/g.26459 Transcript_11145/m.26459 type:complete len:218 (-) Transcript_11145:523-1176(-)|eukprot:CAMPEP_0177618590 /NCGR_PEP_ID=MMETSP0419_2-20121207/25670_1 /TAXON_ID=582737 /ORGANISM="Tetraselmis sp., Strain GSL018" /LENGTH=217 /DNA_ID=CAMNT_0019117525 /DNA_START=145 /DNA_END=798 /DNA_ORIENTATION=+